MLLIAKYVRLLDTHRFSWRDEYDVQAGISGLLTEQGVPHDREVRLVKGRIDVLTDDGVGIEVKVDGSADAVLRQLQGYAADPRITALLLATTRATHLALPRVVRGVPLTVVHLRGF